MSVKAELYIYRDYAKVNECIVLLKSRRYSEVFGDSLFIFLHFTFCVCVCVFVCVCVCSSRLQLGCQFVSGHIQPKNSRLKNKNLKPNAQKPAKTEKYSLFGK